MSKTDLAHILGTSHEALAITGYVCIHTAIADQMTTEHWPDMPTQMQVTEHQRRHEAILSRQMQCPAWDTCKNRSRTARRKDIPPKPARKATELQQKRFQAFEATKIG